MARKITFDGKELYFPDYFTDDQILDRIDEIRALERTGTQDANYGEALQRGFAKGLPGIARLGAGAVGLAGDVADLIPGVEGTLDDTEQSIRDFADDATLQLGGESVGDVSDTFLEKVVEGVGKAPGMALEFAPTMAIPAGKIGQIGKSAVGFAAHGALSEGGRGLGAVGGGALRGAGEGALFAGVGKAVSGFPTEIGRRLGHFAGTAGAITGIGAAYGAPLEDSLAEGLGMGAFGLIGRGHGDKNKVDADHARYLAVLSRADQMMKENPGLDKPQAIKLAAREAEAQQTAEYEPKSQSYKDRMEDLGKEAAEKPLTVNQLALEEQANAGWDKSWPFIPQDMGNADFRRAIKNDPGISDAVKLQMFSAAEKLGVITKESLTYEATPLEHRQKQTEWVDGKPVIKEELPPLSPKMENLQPSFNNIRMGEFGEAVDNVSDSFIETRLRYDPMSYKKHVQQWENLKPQDIAILRKAMGKEVTEHNFVKMQYLAKEMMGEISLQIDQGKKALAEAKATGNPDRIGAAETWLQESRRDFEDSLAVFAGLGREWKHAGKARAAIMAKMPVGERALQTIAKADKVARLSPEMIDAIREDPTNWKAAHEAIKAASDIRTSDYVYEAWINGLLSGPPTHAVNAISNALTQVMSTVERGIAPGADYFRYMLDGGKTPRERFASEFFGDLAGWGAGIKKGLPIALRALRDETFMQEVPTTLEHNKQATIPGAAGQAIRQPSSILRASDMFFKAIASQRELHAIAYRMAAKKGLSGKAKAEYIKDILDNPDVTMIEQMGRASGGKQESLGEVSIAERMKEAEEMQTFTNPLGVVGRVFLEAKKKIPGFRWVIPFVRTPANILKYGLKRTPLGLLDSVKKYAEYRNGTLEAGAVADSAAASLLGTSITAAIVSMAQEGFITGGGPADWNENANKRASGWQPYSIRNPLPIGANDQWVSYSRVEPLAIIMGMAADFVEAAESDELDADKIVTAVKENLTNKTFLAGLEGLTKAWGDPDQYMSKYFKTMVGSMVPAIVGQGTNIADPYSRMSSAFGVTEGIPDVWAGRIPGLSEKLPIRYSNTGEPIERARRVGGSIIGEDAARGISPFSISQIDPSRKLERNMDELSGYEGVPPPMPKRSKRIPIGPGQKKNLKLTESEYEVYMDSRRKATEVLRKIVNQPDWDRKDPFVRAKIIKTIYSKFDSVAGNKVNLMLRQRMKNG